MGTESEKSVDRPCLVADRQRGGSSVSLQQAALRQLGQSGNANQCHRNVYRGTLGRSGPFAWIELNAMVTSNTRLCSAFLDRDGVLNWKMPEGEYVTTPEQFELLPGAVGGLRLLAEAGYRLIVVTNQRGVARGRLTLEQLAAIHQKLVRLLALEGLALDAIYVCPHAAGECDCRKPQPGMLLRAFDNFPDLVPGKCVLFGDSASDIEAARRAGVLAVLMPANGSLEDSVRTWLATRPAADCGA